MFSKGENVLKKRTKDGGFYLAELEGLFSKITRERVSAYVSRWIKNGRLGLDQGEKRRSPVGHSSSHGGSAMAGGKEHAGEHGTVATGHGSKNRGHRESEGVKGSSDRPIWGLRAAWSSRAASETGSTGHETCK